MQGRVMGGGRSSHGIWLGSAGAELIQTRCLSQGRVRRFSLLLKETRVSLD